MTTSPYRPQLSVTGRPRPLTDYQRGYRDAVLSMMRAGVEPADPPMTLSGETFARFATFTGERAGHRLEQPEHYTAGGCYALPFALPTPFVDDVDTYEPKHKREGTTK